MVILISMRKCHIWY